MKRKAVVAMSGGVDSSVAAALMKEDGYEVIGIMMKLWQGEAANNESGCCSVDAAEDARRVAQVLDIPFYVFNFAEHFSKTVIERFVSDYSHGVTPNPCIECNRSVKFSALLERAKAFDAEVLATGHYARVRSAGAGFKLLRGMDPDKDQSYVLYMLGSADLAHAQFPVGEYRKPEIREIAASLGLRTAAKPESQEICFVPNGDSHAFLREKVPAGSQPGPIHTSDGERIGSHRGFAHYTVGQRRGLGVGLGYPVYVKQVRPDDNALIVGTAEEMLSDEMEVQEVSFTGLVPSSEFEASVMTRYRGEEADAKIQPYGSRWIVSFNEPQGLAAPGQAAVFYRDEELLGGGTILRTSA
ncbi:MAG: tRNA 2-thiouridine(34) synthase MnmA [Actinobacteria bacterium]|nr:tRNA 2-thiouridine(34) synthase MnmA [Actinomycetota bacterium]